MIPVSSQIHSYLQSSNYFLGFFQFGNIPNAYVRKVLVLIVISILSLSGWVSYKAVTAPWELREIVLQNKLLSLGASILLDANIFGRSIETYSEHIDTFNIDINFKNWSQLEANRNFFLKDSNSDFTLSDNFNSYVKAIASYGGQKVPIRMRLKGQGTLQHLDGWMGDGKISYRVKVTQGKTILGLRRFALMSPKRRGFLHSWVFRQALFKEDIISKRHILARLKINGDNKGIYFIDEHYDSHLFEYSRRPDSVVVRFHNPWKDPATRVSAVPSNDKVFAWTYAESYPWFETPTYSAYLQRAIDLLDGFRTERYTVPEVFDVGLFARYFALADVFGAWHSLGWQNLRFYFNPITGVLEPIPDDGFNEKILDVPADRLTRLNDSYNNGKFLHRFLEDKRFVGLYLQELDRVSHPTYLEKFWGNLSTPLQRRINFLRKDYPLYDFRYRANQGGVIGILKNEGVGIDEINDRATLLRSMLFDKSSDNLRVAGYNIDELYDSNPRRAGCLTQLQDIVYLPEFVQVAPTTCTLKIPKGTHVFSENLVIPSHVSLVISSGARLVLANGAFIVSRSPIYFRGSSENPISISGIDESGGGILVIDAQERSELRHVRFSGLSSGTSLPYFLNGAVTFYRSDVTIDSTTFDSNISGDDYLNIIASRYLIENTNFRNTVSDGFDSDYSDGRIENVSLENIGLDRESGGDGLDFSGSNALIKNTTFSHVSDKGISVGEGSMVDVRDVVIRNVTNAIVAKDGSVVEIENAVLAHAERALVAIMKKSGYGPAELSATGITLDDVDTPYLLEEGSRMQINGINMTSNTQHGKAIIYQ